LTHTQNKLEEPAVVLRRDDRPGGNVYRAYRPEYDVREHLARGFTVIDFVPEGEAVIPGQTCGCCNGREAVLLRIRFSLSAVRVSRRQIGSL
jgi:hypothetical protein